MLTRIVTIVSLVVLILELLFVIVNSLLKQRSDRIAFIRSFKKGKCAIIYLTAIPLYCVGHIYAEKDFLEAFFLAVNKIINLVVLKYDTASIDALMQHDDLYEFTVYFAFVLVGINALLFTISLTNQHIWCSFQAFKATVTRRDKLFILGENPSNIAIYESDDRHSKVIVDEMPEEVCEKLYFKKIAFISRSYMSFLDKLFPKKDGRFWNWILRPLRCFDRQHIIVVNTGSDEVNMAICRTVIDGIEAANEDAQARMFLNLRVFVFGDPRYETVYSDIISSGYGCIHYINKYQRIAVDFIDQYPFSKFMNETQIDYETSLVRREANMNVMMIGFGKTNQQIFLTSVANNQFLTEGEDGPVLKPVHYHIFDRNAAENNKNLNHSYYRFRNECADLCEEEYLPLPAIPAEESYYRLDVNDTHFYNQIRTIATAGKSDMNFIIIGFGTDLENIDMAQKLVEKREEWGLENLIIFVKVRVWHKQQTLLEQGHCYFIANERDVIYDMEKILGDRLFSMAQMRNEVYDLEYTITHEPDTKIDAAYLEEHHKTSYRNWYLQKTQMERESSLYCCLSLRSKLNLMGLDYCDAQESDAPGLTEEEYLALYAGDDMPQVGAYDVTASGKPIVTYPLDFQHSRRENMAIQEHQRWNSFMISKGMIPSSRKQILTEKKSNGKYSNGKNYAVRRHGNLTTFEGLLEFRRMVSERDHSSELECDVIKYDYQLLDDAYWLLHTCGYKIIRK